MLRITEAGAYPDMSEEDYHKDPAPTPSLSSSTLRTLVGSTLAHAREEHPRLRSVEKPASDAMDKGKLIHQLVMDRGTELVRIDAKDWRTKDAKAERDAARAEGKIAILEADYQEVLPSIATIQDFLRQLPGNPMDPEAYTNEIPCFWREELPVWGRMLLDFMPRQASPSAIIYDLKTSAMGSQVKMAAKRLQDALYPIQAAWYCRGYKKLFGIWPRFVFLCAEVKPPFGIVPIEFDGEALMYASDRIDTAVERWSLALETDSWPAYPPKIQRVGLKPWVAEDWIEQMSRANPGHAMTDRDTVEYVRIPHHEL